MMASMRELLNRMRSFFRKKELDQDLDAELGSHLEHAIDENIQRGMTAEEARRQALIRIGGVTQAKEQQREARGLPALDILMQDLRYTLRTLRRDRSFALIAILILALGIGANIVVFSVVNTILLRPLPFHDPQQLVWITGGNDAKNLSNVTYPVAIYEDYVRQNQSLQSLTSYFAFSAANEDRLMDHGVEKPITAFMVAGNFFQTLGVQPTLGRLFTPNECQKGGRPAVLLTYPFWRRQFNADPSIVGKVVTMDNQPVTVVGVLPSSFNFGSIFLPGMNVQVLFPIIMDDIRNEGDALALIGRLKPGVTVAGAQAEANALFPRINAAHPEFGGGFQAIITGLKDHVSGNLRRSLIVLWSAVGLILLIVCVNLSNLMLARAAARSQEFALRSALGSGRLRLIRQLLTESLVLSIAGAFLGLLLACAGIYALAHSSSIAIPMLNSVTVNGTAVGWTVLITVATAVFFGLAPALKMSGKNLQESLKEMGRGSSTGKMHERLRGTLVILEVALSCVLLIGAGLLLRSFLRIMDVDLGFQPSHAATMQIDYQEQNDYKNPDRRYAALQEILRRVQAIPGIEAAGVTDNLPLERNRGWGFSAVGRAYTKEEEKNTDALVYIVTPGYLGAMGMHLIEGRDISWQDSSKSEPVAVINETAARFNWPGQDPIGRMAMVGGRKSRIIGVISDVRESSVEERSSSQMYLPWSQNGPEGNNLVVRTKLAPDVLESSVMSTLRSMNPAQPATEFRPIQQIVDRAVSPRRFFVLLVGAFAALGLILASLGIYGVISYSVTQRTQEIGIRMALGATMGRVQRDVLWRTLRLALLGIALGAALSFVVARLIAALLFATQPTDHATFAGVALLLIAVAFFAGYIPARRASRIDPMIALRND
ncbi:MAG TPA: ABC transporter permease [Acidobacteriaceae bacterium]|jgi:predicted permease|nr:ABC transporter permease [Acidobacteriaceae bacterium]